MPPILNARHAMTLYGCGDASPLPRRDVQSPRLDALAVNTAIKMTLSASLDQASPENLAQIRHFFKSREGERNPLVNVVKTYSDET